MSATFEIRNLDAPLGADVFGFPFDGYSPQDLATVRAAWLRHQVLRFRETSLDDTQQVRFSAEFGPFVIHPRQLQEGTHGSHPEILVVSNMKRADGSAAGDLGDGEVNWHTDTWFQERPPSASILRAVQVPPSGGNTHFLNMYMALETLPPALRRAIEGKSIHHQTVYDGRGDVRAGMTPPSSDDVRTWPGVDHPIVRTHGESGRDCLFLGGRRHASVVGIKLDEGQALIDALWRHVVRPEFTWTQVWAPGDMVMWDNRCVMHRRDAFDPATIRLMHRTAVQGERPAFRHAV